MSSSLKRSFVAVVLSAGLLVPFGAAAASANHTVASGGGSSSSSAASNTHSRAVVQDFASAMGGAQACSFFATQPTLKIACTAVGATQFAKAISYAADKDCQMRVVTTPNPQSTGSYDRSSVSYNAVNCLS